MAMCWLESQMVLGTLEMTDGDVSVGMRDGDVLVGKTDGDVAGQVMPKVMPWRFLDSVSLCSK